MSWSSIQREASFIHGKIRTLREQIRANISDYSSVQAHSSVLVPCCVRKQKHPHGWHPHSELWRCRAVASPPCQAFSIVAWNTTAQNTTALNTGIRCVWQLPMGNPQEGTSQRTSHKTCIVSRLWKLPLTVPLYSIFIEIEFIYKIILVSGVQYDDLTIIYNTKCSP